MTTFVLANLVFAAIVGVLAGLAFYALQCAANLTARAVSVLATQLRQGFPHWTGEVGNGHAFSPLAAMAGDVTRLEIVAVVTVSLTLGLVLGGLVAIFSRHAARGRLMLGDPRFDLPEPIKLRRGRHRPCRADDGSR